ncbi:hypothetical protein Q3G72_025518 [Acer saccharum]|nr:hypothetical protein Q3G72_025518 [Acer saccharum]
MGLLKLYPRVLEALKRTLLPFRRKLVQMRFLHKLLCFQKQRLVLVSGLKWVDEVIASAPYAITEQFMNRLFNEHKIDYIIHGTVLILVYFQMGLMLMPWQSKLAVTNRLSALKVSPAQIL